MDVVFVYVADKLIDSTRIKISIERLLTKITGIQESPKLTTLPEQQ